MRDPYEVPPACHRCGVVGCIGECTLMPDREDRYTFDTEELAAIRAWLEKGRTP